MYIPSLQNFCFQGRGKILITRRKLFLAKALKYRCRPQEGKARAQRTFFSLVYVIIFTISQVFNSGPAFRRCEKRTNCVAIHRIFTMPLPQRGQSKVNYKVPSRKIPRERDSSLRVEFMRRNLFCKFVFSST